MVLIERRNLDIISSFTDTPSERHFFCVSALIEMRGAPAMRLMSSILDEAFLGDALSRTRITSHFLALAGHVDSCTAAVASMRTLCDPSTFFHTIRLWFHAGPRLLDGELYELGGPSAGQSSFVHALDVFLGISHSPAPDADSAEDTFMQRMLAYMPSAHRTFLLHLATEALPVRQLVVDEAERSPALTKAYDGVVEAVKRLRDEHMRLVQVRRVPLSAVLPNDLPIRTTCCALCGPSASLRPIKTATTPREGQEVRACTNQGTAS
jgi:indoleamine 2,3-dioxygenase